MKVIGLTGGIGSGKSTVAQYLAKLGAVIIDADKIGHEILKSDAEVRRKVVAAFGRQILDPGGEIDRQKLGEIVFNHPESLSLLNQLMHPLMYDIAKTRIEEYRQQGVGVVVLEAALLVEIGWTSLVDELWVTVASEANALKRLQKQRGLTEEQTLARLRSQLSSEERIKHANAIINNDGDLDEMKTRVRELWLRLQSQGGRNSSPD
ncbi:MAG: dephospho-CoA kinase [Chloroflexi bacterium]|nr:dephospho-CoA kinase [Chloroflexota bacterium]